MPSSDGVTPTHVAAAWDRTRILHLLLLNGGDPWIQDDDQKTAFHYAFEEKAKDAMDMLHDFQKIHWASKLETPDFEPKFRIDSERLLLRYGEEMLVYVPEEKITKSTMTQTQEISTPVRGKIQENGWPKDRYQTPGEVLVHSDPKSNPQTFVTTVEIIPKIRPEPVVKKAPDIKDKKPQISFSELQEAVKNFRLRNPLDSTEVRESFQNSRVEPLQLSKMNFRSRNPLDSAEVGESFQISGVEPLQQSSIKEIWINSDAKSDADLTPSKTVDLCDSSLARTSAYFSCTENSDCKIISPNDKANNSARQNMSNESFLSVAEECRYTDTEENVVLLEKNLLVNPEIR